MPHFYTLEGFDKSIGNVRDSPELDVREVYFYLLTCQCDYMDMPSALRIVSRNALAKIRIYLDHVSDLSIAPSETKPTLKVRMAFQELFQIGKVCHRRKLLLN